MSRNTAVMAAARARYTRANFQNRRAHICQPLFRGYYNCAANLGQLVNERIRTRETTMLVEAQAYAAAHCTSLEPGSRFHRPRLHPRNENLDGQRKQVQRYCL
jgi:hypothetical protein